MAKPKLTIEEARRMPFTDLVETADRLIGEYSKVDGETHDEQMARLTRTLDEVPDLYRWFLTLQSYFDHWTDAMADQYSRNAMEYKSMRQRRDAMDRAASAAKRRYEGASRIVTILLGQDEAKMPRGR